MGALGGRGADRGHRRLARPVDRVMSATDATPNAAGDLGTATERGPAGAVQGAAAAPPFPPIAEYGFISNCHTGALIAPDGAIGWLCVPRFDAPSVLRTLVGPEGGDLSVS